MAEGSKGDGAGWQLGFIPGGNIDGSKPDGTPAVARRFKGVQPGSDAGTGKPIVARKDGTSHPGHEVAPRDPSEDTDSIPASTVAIRQTDGSSGNLPRNGLLPSEADEGGGESPKGESGEFLDIDFDRSLIKSIRPIRQLTEIDFGTEEYRQGALGMDLPTFSTGPEVRDYPSKRLPYELNKYFRGHPNLALKEGPHVPLDEIAARLNSKAVSQERHGKDKFTISGNASPEEAEVVYLAESGHSFGQHVTFVDYLQGVVKPGDSVLVEGFQAGEIVDREQAEVFVRLPDDVEVLGWEDMELHAKATQLYDELDKINEELAGTGIPEEEKTHRRLYKIADLLPRIHQIAILDRNERLRATLDQVRRDKPGSKTYVIAGVNHLEKDEQQIQYSEQFPYAILTLNNEPNINLYHLVEASDQPATKDLISGAEAGILPLPTEEFHRQYQERTRKITAITEREFIDRFLVRRELQSLEEILEKENVAPDELSTAVQRRVSKIVRESKISGQVNGEDVDVDFLYNIYTNLSADSPSDGPGEIAHPLVTFDQFIASYAPITEPETLANVIKRIDSYMNTVVHSARTLNVSYRGEDDSLQTGIYVSDGEWLHLPGDDPAHRRYVERTIVDEVIILREEGGLPKGCVFHATGSASLDGIGENGAILSAREAQVRGQTVKTGEFVTQIGWGNVNPLTDERVGLSDVYAKSGLNDSFAIIRWFNEFPVVFGISKEKFEKYLESKGKYSEIADFGEGYVLGPEVPLETVDTVSTYSRFLPQLATWTQENLSEGVKVVSLEAAMIYDEISQNLDDLQAQTGVKLNIKEKSETTENIALVISPVSLEVAEDPNAIITTSEGFNIRGENETSLIRSLTSFNGTPIADLERKMEPVYLPFINTGSLEGISHAGFLGIGESFIDVLAEDNETVLGMGLTHKKLAEFLHKFDRAIDDFSGKLFGITFNGVTFGHTVVRFNGYQRSPFDDDTATDKDHTIINLTTGAQIRFSGLLPEMIDRYGFYEGKGTSYRLDPQYLAEIAGFTPPPADDPVVQLVKDKEAQVEITTRDQFNRIHNLLSAEVDVLSGQNYRFVPEDLSSLMQLFRLYGKSPYYTFEESTEQIMRRERIIARIDTRNLIPCIFQQEFSDNDTLLQIIPANFPQFKQIILDRIDQLSLPTNLDNHPDQFSTELFLRHILGSVSKKIDGQDNPDKDYYKGLLRKLARDSDSIGLLIKAATHFVSKPELLATLDSILPEFKTDVITLYIDQGIYVSDGMTLEELVRLQKEMDVHIGLIDYATDLAINKGRVENVQKEDIEALVTVMEAIKNNPDYHVTNDEEEFLRRLNIDPGLISYAFKAVSRSHYKWDTNSLILVLYRGSAKIEQDVDQLLTTLPDNTTTQARVAIEALYVNQQSDYAHKIDLDAFTQKIIARAKRAKEFETDLGQVSQITEGDILNDYLELAVPQFSGFLTHPLVKKSIGNLAKDPLSSDARIDVCLDTSVLESLPEIEVQDSFKRTVKYRELTIGDQVYFIGEREIVKGEPKKDAETLGVFVGDAIGLSVEMMY